MTDLPWNCNAVMAVVERLTGMPAYILVRQVLLATVAPFMLLPLSSYIKCNSYLFNTSLELYLKQRPCLIEGSNYCHTILSSYDDTKKGNRWPRLKFNGVSCVGYATSGVALWSMSCVNYD